MNKKQQDKIRRNWKKYMEWTYQVTIDKIGKDNYKHYYTASQEELVREQYTQEIERSAITKLIQRTMHKWPKFLVNAMTKQFDVHEKHGWLFEFPRKDFFMGQNCLQCGALLWLQEQGAPEICTIICSTDYISASYLKGLTFIRTKTLADGDEMCDFQYYRADRDIDMDSIELK
jgi:hypothetical protein